MGASVPERLPREVGTPLPLSPLVPPETYTYDYIIVGGGTAGCVLASRLSEDPGVSVLVIEQGPVSNTWASRVPLISGNIYDKSNLSTKLWSQPLRHVDNRYLEVIYGQALGGTTRVNGMLYTRGCPGDYNQWKALGNDGWGYEDLEPYFAKSEKSHSHPESAFRGKKGVWENRNFAESPYKIIDYVDRAMHKSGVPRIEDANAPDVPAAHTALLDVIQDSGYRRHSAFLAFLPPKLTICPNSVVCRDGVRATGVHFETLNSRKADFRYVAKARREVIVCAGAIGSPQVLMLSGLGPNAHLEEKGVAVVVDLPAVGSHLSDHMGVPVAVEVPIEDSLHILEVSPVKAVLELLKYLTVGGGSLARPFQNISSFFPSRLVGPEHTIATAPAAALDATVPANRPDIELMHLTNNCADIDTDGIGVFTLMVTLIRPRSEGTVRLATANPRARPDVDLNYLADPADYEPVRRGVRFALRVLDDVRAQGYPVKRDLQVPPDGGKDDASLDAVVDTALRVHGVQGLRVCDASVFPEIIGSHTMAPTVAVAEKCADLVKAAWPRHWMCS
ncbi:alcohol oxidase [Epithele typhae]|uniref:alcohol oxidase n=1 Tax=Epithele typhae TaxID=378194 RepID=UPI0020086B37|nr:alcohol oxidase [Epithele typhae]KAH9926550.1 alcohol oxidase [Epithele typhae]